VEGQEASHQGCVGNAIYWVPGHGIPVQVKEEGAGAARVRIVCSVVVWVTELLSVLL
jgi:hypothetical protein